MEETGELTSILCTLLLVAWVVLGALGIYHLFWGGRPTGGSNRAWGLLGAALFLAIVWAVVC